MSTIERLVKQYPARSEAYIKLWQIYMSIGKEHEDASKQTQKEQINRHNSRSIAQSSSSHTADAHADGSLKLSLLSETEGNMEEARK